MPEAVGPWLGIDYGARRIGVAFLGESGLAAQGLQTVRNGPQGPDWAAMDRIFRDWQPGSVVLGLPLQADGQEGAVAKAARSFAAALQRRHPVPLLWIDERLSSHAAESLLQERGLDRKHRDRLRDQVAACEILHTWREEQTCTRNGI